MLLLLEQDMRDLDALVRRGDPTPPQRRGDGFARQSVAGMLGGRPAVRRSVRRMLAAGCSDCGSCHRSMIAEGLDLV